MASIRVETNVAGESWVGTFTTTKRIYMEDNHSVTDIDSDSCTSVSDNDLSESDTESLLEASIKRQSVLDIQESHMLELMTMQELFPGAPVHDLIRFLKARNFNATNAAAMYEAHLHWRSETLPIHKEEVEVSLAARRYYVLDDLDKDGHPVIVFCLRRFHESPFDPSKEIRTMIYFFEKQVKPRFGPSFEKHKVTVLVDISGGYSKAPLGFFRQANAVMEANFPDFLFRAVVLPVPYWLQKVLGGLLSFIREETRAKVAYVNHVTSLEDAAQLPIEKMGPDVQAMIQSKQLRH